MASFTFVVIETLIVDDEPDMRMLLRALFTTADDISIAGEASDGDEAVDRIIEMRPAVVVLDEMMPGRRGLEVVRALREQGAETEIVLWSANLTSRLVSEARELGVRRCVPKSELHSLVAAVREAAPATA